MYGGGPQTQGGGRGNDDAALMAALMAAAAQEDAERRRTKYAEAVLPVALLVILALIFAVKLGFIDLSFIPVFNQPVSVMILTDNATSPEIQNTLQVLQKNASYYRIKTRTLQISPNRHIYASQLADADVVILYETDTRPTLSLEQRSEIAKFLRAGGKMIVVKNSGTYVPECDIVGVECDKSNVLWKGWIELDDFMPVECYSEESCQPETVGNAVIYSINPDHPILRGFETIPGPDTYLTLESIRDLQLSKNGTDIADIYEGGLDNPAAVFPAITIGGSLTGAKVIHFNYDPWKTSNVFIQAILYLSGRTG